MNNSVEWKRQLCGTQSRRGSTLIDPPWGESTLSSPASLKSLHTCLNLYVMYFDIHAFENQRASNAITMYSDVCWLVMMLKLMYTLVSFVVLRNLNNSRLQLNFTTLENFPFTIGGRGTGLSGKKDCTVSLHTRIYICPQPMLDVGAQPRNALETATPIYTKRNDCFTTPRPTLRQLDRMAFPVIHALSRTFNIQGNQLLPCLPCNFVYKIL